MKDGSASEDIVKNLFSYIKPLLKYELENNEDLDSAYVLILKRYFKIFIFYNELNKDNQKKLSELIDNYIWNFIRYKLNYEIFLPNILIRKIREHIGYNRELIYFNFECLPKRLLNKIDACANSIFPLFYVRYFPSELKGIVPPRAIKIND